MPVTTHTKAGDDHRLAAKTHEVAAECNSNGDHASAVQNATKAKGCCDAAQKSIVDAHGKSTMQAKK